MTWYWWKHWFWITGVLSLVLPISSTYPITPIYKEYKKEKSSKFPLAGQTDIDHVFDGNDGMPGLIIRDRDNQIPGSIRKDIITDDGNHHNTAKQSDNIKIIGNLTQKIIHSNNESLSISDEDYTNHTTTTTDNNNNSNNESSSSSEINRTTKGVDLSLVNNTDSNITSLNSNSNIYNINNNNNNTVSTNSSLVVVKQNASQPITIIASIKNESQSTINNQTTAAAIVGTSHHNTTIDCESASDIIGEESSSEESQNNKTTTIHVDLIDDNDDNNNNNNNNNDNDDDNNNNNDDDSTFDSDQRSDGDDDGNLKVMQHNKSINNHNKNITKEEEVIRAEIERQLDGERGRKSKVLAEYRHELKYINFSSDAKNLLARSAAVSLDFDEPDDGNVSSEALAIHKTYILNAGTISGICLSALVLCFAVSLAGITVYRRRYLNKPQTLSEPDSSGYIDDSTIRDNSDEMYSLDNDSFLNSLEAMTIQNYWTDTVKHTKL